jgi:phosphoribosylanthranilate isomerase
MSRLPFKIKVCGVTSVEDAQLAVRAGADAIGLNFYSGSKRFVTPDRAKAIVNSLPPSITKVGVFVNHSADEVEFAMQQVGLDLLQFHGVETPEFISQFSGIRVMRAFRWKGDGKSIEDFLSECAVSRGVPSRILLDSDVAGQFGGSGATADWAAIRNWIRQWKDPVSLVLAGGLTPSNVEAAIGAVLPDAVDTASGVESSLGRKDLQLCEAFVAAARKAFSSWGQDINGA